jgi:hypothetical protein
MLIPAVVCDVVVSFVQNGAGQCDELLIFVIDKLGDWYEEGLKDLKNFSIEWFDYTINFLENPLSQKSFMLLQVSTCSIVAIRALFSSRIIQKAWSGILISVAYTLWTARDLKSLQDQSNLYRELNGQLRQAIGIVQASGGDIQLAVQNLVAIVEQNRQAAEESRQAAENNRRSTLELQAQVARLGGLGINGTS